MGKSKKKPEVFPPKAFPAFWKGLLIWIGIVLIVWGVKALYSHFAH